ncbi:MAG TPA: UPF0182 family protein, partial [Coleofasciculaceae cyanobacterium]
MTDETSRRFRNQIFRFVTVLMGLWFAWDLLSHLIAEVLWFNNVGYLDAFLKRLQTQLGLWVVVGGTSAGFLFGNLFLANRLKHSDTNLLSRIFPEESPARNQRLARMNLRQRTELQTVPQSMRVGTGSALQEDTIKFAIPLRLRSLLPLVILLSLLVGAMLLHYSKIVLSLWRPNLSLPYVTPSLPPAFDWLSGSSIGQLLPLQLWQFPVFAVIAIAVIVNPQFWLTAIASVLSLFFALVLSSQWSRVLQYFSPTAFNTVDPLFKRDISFYVFSFPVWQLLNFWLGGLCLFSLLAVTLIYVLSGNSFSDGKFPGFSSSQLRHLYALGSAVSATVALRYWLSRYELLYSLRGVSYGAGYTDINVQLPINTGLTLLTGAITLFLLVRTIVGLPRPHTSSRTRLVLLGFYLAVVGIAGSLVPAAVQRFNVQPNELDRERPYIERSIALTRKAFDLNNIDARIFNPEGNLTRSDIGENVLTIRNIRLWDTRPILETNRQLQRIRLYYEFPGADIDRYTLPVEATGVSASFEGEEGEQP